MPPDSPPTPARKRARRRACRRLLPRVLEVAHKLITAAAALAALARSLLF